MIQPKKIFRTENGRLGFVWNDNSKSCYSPRFLRTSCPCALCVDEYSGKKLLDDNTIPESIKILHIRSVGRYAVSVTFDDGHQSGIYPYEKLKELTEVL